MFGSEMVQDGPGDFLTISKKTERKHVMTKHKSLDLIGPLTDRFGPSRCRGWIGAPKLPLVDLQRAPTDVWGPFFENFGNFGGLFGPIFSYYLGPFWPGLAVNSVRAFMIMCSSSLFTISV